MILYPLLSIRLLIIKSKHMKWKEILIAWIKTAILAVIFALVCGNEKVDIAGCIAVYALYKSFRNDKDRI